MQLDRPLAVITPTADADVLVVLARVDARMTIAQIGRVLDRYSNEGIRKVLLRLVEQGIVHTERAGRTSAFWLNREHLAAEAVMAVGESKERLLERMRDALRAWPIAIAYGAVFGSAARGSMRADSDIDLLVVHDDDASELDLQERSVDLMLKTYRWTGNSLSMVLMSVTELKERAKEPLLRDVRDEALTVAGSRKWFTAQFGVKAGHANA